MENQNLATSELCTIAIVFPLDSDEQILSIKAKIKEALKDLPKVKIEYRFAELRDGSHVVGQS